MNNIKWCIDINDPSTWEPVEENIDKDEVIKKVDNIKELVHIKEVDEEIYNCLEYVEATLEERVPIYK